MKVKLILVALLVLAAAYPVFGSLNPPTVYEPGRILWGQYWDFLGQNGARNGSESLSVYPPNFVNCTGFNSTGVNISQWNSTNLICLFFPVSNSSSSNAADASFVNATFALQAVNNSNFNASLAALAAPLPLNFVYKDVTSSRVAGNFYFTQKAPIYVLIGFDNSISPGEYGFTLIVNNITYAYFEDDLNVATDVVFKTGMGIIPANSSYRMFFNGAGQEIDFWSEANLTT